jgi:hypothetical protein
MTDFPNVIQQVPFGDSFAFLVTSHTLRAYLAQRIVEWVLPYREVFPPDGILKHEFPLEPLDGLVQTCFEWIRRYTYIQHNYMLFAFTVPEEPDSSDMKIIRYLHRKCVVFVDKVHQQFYLVKYRFGDDVFKGTLLDGILLQDRAVYPALTPNHHPKDIKETIPFKLHRMYDIIVENTNLDESDEELRPTHQDEMSISEEEPETIQRPVISDPKEILENYRKTTTTMDFTDVFQQKRNPAKYVFYIQGVYALCGENQEYSLEKLVNAISYKTCVKLHTHLLGSPQNYIQDPVLEPVELRNAVDTMYYTRHTKVLLKNPFSNDYLRYQPMNFELVDKKGLLTFPKEYENFDDYYQRELFHFFPLFDEQGRKFLDHYTVDDHVIKCQVHKTDDVYVYKLTSEDKRFNMNTNNGYAKIWTYEGTRYLRVLWHKIHIAYKKNIKKDGKQVHPSEIEDKPMFMYCIGVKSKQSRRYVGWTPVMYIKNNQESQFYRNNNRNNTDKGGFKYQKNKKNNQFRKPRYNKK